MPRVITSGELINLRKNERRSKLFLAFHPYNTVFSCLVNQASFDADEVTQITYDGATGTYSDIKPGMTVWVGSAAGGYDLGMARIRKVATATVLYFGRGSEIIWEDNLYVTVVDDFDIWAKHWLVVGDAQVYIDQDIEYSDQNSDRNPVAVLGPDAVVELSGASVTHARDASGSWVIGSTISGYAWTVTGSGASVTDETTATPTFTFTAAGVKRINLTVTAANGKTTTVYRYVHVFSAASLPANEFSVRKISGDLDSGGWSFQVIMYGDANLPSVRDHAKCILFAQDWYGDTRVSIGEQTGVENIVSWGWIDGETIVPNPETGGSVAFTVRGPSYWMQELSSFPGGLKAVSGTPSSWLYTQDLTVDVALWHLLYWRSTIMDVMDVILSGDDRVASALTTYSDGFWDQLIEVSDKILARPSVNRLGRLYVQIDPQLMPVASRSSIPIVMEIAKSDWMSVEIERVTRTAINRMETSGVSSDGSPLFSHALGKIITRFGRGGSTRDNLMLSDQDQLNVLTGLLYAKETNQFPNVDIQLAQNNRMIDIAGQQYVSISLVATDTPRGVVWSAKKLIPTRVEFEYDGENGVMSTSLECEAETEGPAGVTVIIPPPAIEGETNLEIPDFEDIDWPALTPIGTFFPPYINPEPVVPGESDCPSDAPANGPFSMNIYGTLDSTNFIKAAYFDVVIRTNGHDNKTTYVIKGTFQKLKPGEDPDNDASYEETLEDNWYDVFVYNLAGTLIATGVHDPVTNPKVRTGVLNAIAASQIHKIEISMGSNQIFRPSVTYSDGIWSAAGSYKLEGDTYKSGNWGSGIWVRVQNVAYAGPYGDGAMGVRYPGVWSHIFLGEDHEYGGKSFYIKQFSWFRLSTNTNIGLGTMHSIEGRSAVAYNIAPTWSEAVNKVDPTGPILSLEHVGYVTLGEFSDLFFSTNSNISVAGVPNGTFLSECILHQIYVRLASTYKIQISQVNLWNVCPRVS